MAPPSNLMLTLWRLSRKWKSRRKREAKTDLTEMERMAPTDKDGWEKAEEEVHKIITKAQALGI